RRCARLGRPPARPRRLAGSERRRGGTERAGPAGGGVAAGRAPVVLRAVDAADQGPGRSWRPPVRPGAVHPLEPEEPAMTDTTTPTTATTVFEPVHLVEVESYSPYDNAWAAECSCGWNGDLQRERDAAVADGDEHRY